MLLLINIFKKQERGVSAQVPNFNKVLVIVFENAKYANAVKQPYFASLVKEGALLTNFQAATNPSQGNYIAITLLMTAI